jgi:hypothetical protein
MRDPAHGQEPRVHGAQKPGPSLFAANERSDTIFPLALHFSATERSDWKLNVSNGVSFQSLFKSRQQFKLTRAVLHFEFDRLFLGSVSFTLE